MALMEKEEDTVLSQDLGVILFSLKRTLQGTKIFVQSSEIEEFFKGLSDKGKPPYKAERWKGISLYPLPPEVVHEHLILEHCHIDIPEAHLLNSGLANLTFLRAVGLTKGVSFLVGTMPCRRAYLEEFSIQFNRGFREIYNNYIRPFEVEILVTKETRRD